MSSKVSSSSSEHLLIFSFSVDLVLDVVNPLVELGDIHLSVLEPCLSHLVLLLEAVDLLHELLLPLECLLRRLLQLLHVLTHSLKLLLNALQVLLNKLSPLEAPLKLTLLHSELPGELIQLLLIVMGHLDGGAEVLVQLLNGDLVVHAGGLHHLDSLEDIVGSL